MAGFLYYFPGAKVLDGRDVAAKGLSARLDGDIMPGRIERGGPDGGDGFIATLDASHDCTISLGEQEWKLAAGGYWVGRWTADRITPGDLSRPRQYGGHAVTLGDGNTWLVPVVRLLDGDSPLPQTLTKDADGAIAGTILPRFRELWDMAARVWDGIERQASAGSRGRPMPREEGWVIAIEALALNYRIGDIEAGMLGLLTDETLLDVLEAVVDWPTFNLLLTESKKNDPALTAAG